MTNHCQIRDGFTAIELLMVIGIMMILLGIAVPSVMPAIRHGKINSAVADITDCWRQARELAISTPVPSGANPPHFGIVIDQTSGQRPFTAVIFDNSANGNRIYLRGMDPRDPSTWGTGSIPVIQHVFSRQLILATTPVGGGPPTTGDRHIVLYAQYGTGLPISPTDVAGNQGLIAAPSSLGVTSPAIGTTTVCPVVQIQTLDYAMTPIRRGYASLFSIYHAGFITVQEL